MKLYYARSITIFVSILLGLMSESSLANVNNYFLSIKNKPDELYQFFKKMPKGGELHYHLAGGASPEAMLSVAHQKNYCMDKLSYTIHVSKRVPTRTHCHGVLLNKLRKNSALYNDTLQAWSLKNFTPTNESNHDHFFASFFKFFPIVSDYGPELLADVMKHAAKQHELYMEVMILPDDALSSRFGALIKHTTGLKQKEKILSALPQMHENIQHTIIESNLLLTKTRQQLHCDSDSKDPACALTVKFLYIILREQPLDNFFAQAFNGFAAASKSNELIGINLVQAEDGPISLHDYRRQMNIINFLHHAYPTVHISLHAGELAPGKLGLNKVKPIDLQYHIFDAIHTGHAERIGHGTDIDYEKYAEDTLNHMAQESIPVEINLTSNQKLLNIERQKNPITHYLKHNVPVILSTDDEGILRTDLTREYVKAVTEQGLDYDKIKTINRNTLTYSFLPGKSLWKDPNKGRLVDACSELHSPQCQAFIAHNEKAKLQWELETQLGDFERNF
jgi:adenosine deaminase